MGGIYIADNILQHYSIGRKSFHTYRRILYHGIELCLHNAHIMEHFVERPGQGATLRRGAACSIVSSDTPHCHVGRPRLTEADRLMNVWQHLSFVRPGRAKNRDCLVCAKKMHELYKRKQPGDGGEIWHTKRSNYDCIACDVHLCIGEVDAQGKSINNWFFLWHNNVDYWRAWRTVDHIAAQVKNSIIWFLAYFYIHVCLVTNLLEIT